MPLRRHGNEVSSDQRKDQVSHFILRLAYCRTEDLRNWCVVRTTSILSYQDRQDDAHKRHHLEYSFLCEGIGPTNVTSYAID